MAEPNGNYDPLENLRLLNEAARRNLDEQEAIWKAIQATSDNVHATNMSVQNLIGAIRERIDRIPPENLR
jgi:hypothetical protein